MSLPDKDFISAWLMKAQSQLEQSQADIDLDADIGMYDAENDVILPPTKCWTSRNITEQVSVRVRPCVQRVPGPTQPVVLSEVKCFTADQPS